VARCTEPNYGSHYHGDASGYGGLSPMSGDALRIRAFHREPEDSIVDHGNTQNRQRSDDLVPRGVGHENLLADVDFRQCLNNGASDECPRHGFSFAVGGLVYFPSLLHHKQYFYKRKLTDPRWARQREMSLWGTVSLLLLAVVRFAEVPARTGEIGIATTRMVRVANMRNLPPHTTQP